MDADKGDGEVEGGVAGYDTGDAFGAEAYRGGEDKAVCAAGFHKLETLGKAWYNVVYIECDGGAGCVVKDGTVAEACYVLHIDFVVDCRHGALTLGHNNENEARGVTTAPGDAAIEST